MGRLNIPGGARPFRFGVSMRLARSGAEWQARARRAEELGYSALLVPDHLAGQLSPWTALAIAAAATERMRIGTFVLNNDLRHPVVVAHEAASLQILSGGRVELGLGSGHMKREYDEAGIPFWPGAVRAERLAESVRIVKSLLHGEAVDFAGRHYRVKGHRLEAVPDVPPPILVGGNRDSILELAGREADIAGLTGFTIRKGGLESDTSTFTGRGIQPKIDLVRSAAGPRFGDLELNALLQEVLVTDDRAGAAAEMSAGRWQGLAPEQLLDSPFLLVGTVDEIADQLREWRERFGISYWTVFEPAFEQFAPVVAQLAGA